MIKTFADFVRAIHEGKLFEVSDVAKELGCSIPIAVSAELWNSYLNLDGSIAAGQTKEARIWNVVHLLISALKTGNHSLKENSVVVTYTVHFAVNRMLTYVPLKAIIRRGIEGNAFVLIMLATEDEHLIAESSE